MDQILYSPRCIHFVADHLLPLITGQPPCKLEGSSDASGLVLQKSNALPIFGFTERPCLPHSDNSFHHGTEVMFPFAAGNTVSPPSSISDLHQDRKNMCDGYASTVCQFQDKQTQISIPCQPWEISYRYIRTVAVRWPPFLVLNSSRK